MRKFSPLVISCVVSILFFGLSVKKINAQNLSLQSSFDATAAVSSSGNAGIAFTGTEYWLSKWYTDSVYTLTTSGTVTSRFVIPGVTGIRAFTWDGTFIYAAVDTRIIYKINPVTKTLVSTITAPIVTRHLCYTAAANSGNGGFWIGDDFGDLLLINLAGATLQTIPEETHGLNVMWGSAFDSTTTNGGPYLWIFDRGSTGNGANLVRIPVSTGVPDYVYNVLNDFPGASTAAGAYMSYSITPGQKTLIVVLQSIPNIVARYNTPSILPVRIVSFTGEQNGAKNTLTWKTASEQNNRGFELQRSADGNSFTTLAFVASKAINGSSATPFTYSADDVQPLKGNNYYRLRQLDKDGKATISQTVVLKGASLLTAQLSNVYPNPVSAAIHISLYTPADGRVLFVVTDMKGTAVVRQTAAAKAGSNLFTLPAERLPAGSYILKSVDANGQTTGETKFIKQ